ncbi:MAG: type I 3-dehydroquinate dehydratase [Bacteroidota bacterium]
MLCVSIIDNDKSKILQILSQVEMAEIRLDYMNLSTDEFFSIFESHSNLIATCRIGNYDDKARLALLKQAVIAGAAFIDIEIDAPIELVTELVQFAKDNKCKVILSYHNTSETPETSRLTEIIKNSFSKGADLVKIATTANSMQDSVRVLSLYEKHENLVAIAMGEYGRITRVASLFLGAPFTFVAIDEVSVSAPGQLSKAEMETIQGILCKKS